MAVVRELVKQDIEKESRHTEVKCTYSIVEWKGQKYLQIDTYESATRKIPGKKSQSIRFSPDAIKQLLVIIEREL